MLEGKFEEFLDNHGDDIRHLLALSGLVYIGFLCVKDTRPILALRFNVGLEKIVVFEKPHACDFLSAPIGFKNCKYETVYSQTSGGMLIVRYEKTTE